MELHLINAALFIKETYGTGSCPCPPQGWHLAIRFTDSHPPFKIPYFLIASRLYWEQVGMYRHLGPNAGDNTY